MSGWSKVVQTLLFKNDALSGFWHISFSQTVKCRCPVTLPTVVLQGIHVYGLLNWPGVPNDNIRFKQVWWNYLHITYCPCHWNLLLVQEFPNLRLISAVQYSDSSTLKYLLVPTAESMAREPTFLITLLESDSELAKETASPRRRVQQYFLSRHIRETLWDWGDLDRNPALQDTVSPTRTKDAQPRCSHWSRANKGSIPLVSAF